MLLLHLQVLSKEVCFSCLESLVLSKEVCFSCFAIPSFTKGDLLLLFCNPKFYQRRFASPVWQSPVLSKEICFSCLAIPIVIKRDSKLLLLFGLCQIFLNWQIWFKTMSNFRVSNTAKDADVVVCLRKSLSWCL